jgi:hypothetical protein
LKVAAAPHFFHLALGYSFVLLIWYSAWVLVGDRVWWFALINHVAVWGFLPLPFLLLYAARSRFRRNLLFLLPARSGRLGSSSDCCDIQLRARRRFFSCAVRRSRTAHEQGFSRAGGAATPAAGA